MHGLHALKTGTPIAVALTAFSCEEKVQALGGQVLLAGLIQLALGLLKLGGLMRFLANVVMIRLMPAIVALLIVAGFGAIKPDRIADVWHFGWEPRAILLTTFVATMCASSG